MTDSPTHIAVCDDEPLMRRMLADHLTACGWRVTGCDGAAALARLMEEDAPALVILDVRMPGTDGLTALRQLRENSRVPVIMLTALSDTVDKVLGLEFGADDYLVKPVDMRELQARVTAALRRTALQVEEEEERQRLTGTVPFGACRLDLDAARLWGSDGEEIAITAMEFSMLRTFAQNRGRVLHREQLMEQAHDRGWEHFDRSIDLRVSRLRRKIERHPEKPETIRTVRGIGYVFS